MWTHLRKPLIALSLGLNLAFVAIWMAHSIPGWTAGLNVIETDSGPAEVPSPLHREIGVTPEQWKQMEPIINDFQEKARKQRHMISSLRGQMMNILTMPVVDETAIRSKQEEILAGQRRMQNLVIGHLLKEREILTPAQVRKLMQALYEQCRREGGMVTEGGFGRVLDEHSHNGSMDNENK